MFFPRDGFALTIFCVFLLMAACASPKPITGGEKDEIPPAIIREESTPNRQTNFSGDEIVLEFDEWVVLKDIYNQMIISPLMPDEPEIRQKGKAVIIDLPDSLRQNTTYTINFGDGITDLTEGNVLEDFVFVFSTGPQLDSLRISGTVVDATTIKAADNVWVMLYDNIADSAVYKRRPDYLAKTNSSGAWTISFLPSDTFYVVALKDENVNYIYDQDSEKFGWLEEPVFTSAQVEQLPAILLFPRESRSIIADVIHYAPGWMKIIVPGPLPKAIPQFSPSLDSTFTYWGGDTLHVWYPPTNNYSGRVILNNDTTQIRSSSSPSLTTQAFLLKSAPGRVRTGGPAIFLSNIPIIGVDTSRIEIKHDSLGMLEFQLQLDSIDQRKMIINAPWVGPAKYKLTMLPGALEDFWGRTNDTIFQTVAVNATDQFGDLTMSIEGLDSTRQYVVSLKEGEQIVDTFVVQGVTQTQLVKRGLLPSNYTIEIVEDLNRNLVWDTGNYAKNRQPERRMFFTPEKLRADWEQEIKMMWKTTITPDAKTKNER